MTAVSSAPIGVFDSGVGGLTVLAALQHQLATQRFIYLGDTARLPYGTKSGDTIIRYALQAAALLVERGIGALVVACNTASSVALPALRERFPAGAGHWRCRTWRGSRLCGVRQRTDRGHRDRRHRARWRLSASDPGAAARSAGACRGPARCSSRSLREGWHDNDVALAAVRRYIEPLLERSGCDTLVLGCTHFPIACAGHRARLRARGAHRRLRTNHRAGGRRAAQRSSR